MKNTKKCRAVLVDVNGSYYHKLWFSTQLNLLQYCNCKNNLSGFSPKQIVLISLDQNEKIEVGDLCYYNNKIFKIERGDNELFHLSRKVIATDDQLSSEYVKQFIDEYNEFDSYSGMRIVKDIEIEMDEDIAEYVGPFNRDAKTYKPKLTNGFVTIITKSDKILETIDDTSDDGSNPQPQILYTEEEVLKILNKIKLDCIMYRNSNVQHIDTVEWFSQNKKN